MTYYGVDLGGAHLPFNFQLILLPWNARVIDTADRRLRGRAAGRMAGRTGCSAITISLASPAGLALAQARVAAMLLLTLRGTPTMYYGDEIGMHAGRNPARAGAGSVREWACPASASGATERVRRCSGMPSPNAGFSAAADPGCRWPTIYRSANVAAQRGDPRLDPATLYRRLIAAAPPMSRALQLGIATGRSDWRAQTADRIVRRTWPPSRFMVALNLGRRHRRGRVARIPKSAGTVLCARASKPIAKAKPSARS